MAVNHWIESPAYGWLEMVEKLPRVWDRRNSPERGHSVPHRSG